MYLFKLNIKLNVSTLGLFSLTKKGPWKAFSSKDVGFSTVLIILQFILSLLVINFISNIYYKYIYYCYSIYFFILFLYYTCILELL